MKTKSKEIIKGHWCNIYPSEIKPLFGYDLNKAGKYICSKNINTLNCNPISFLGDAIIPLAVFAYCLANRLSYREHLKLLSNEYQALVISNSKVIKKSCRREIGSKAYGTFYELIIGTFFLQPKIDFNIISAVDAVCKSLCGWNLDRKSIKLNDSEYYSKELIFSKLSKLIKEAYFRYYYIKKSHYKPILKGSVLVPNRDVYFHKIKTKNCTIVRTFCESPDDQVRHQINSFFRIR